MCPTFTEMYSKHIFQHYHLYALTKKCFCFIQWHHLLFFFLLLFCLLFLFLCIVCLVFYFFILFEHLNLYWMSSLSSEAVLESERRKFKKYTQTRAINLLTYHVVALRTLTYWHWDDGNKYLFPVVTNLHHIKILTHFSSKLPRTSLPAVVMCTVTFINVHIHVPTRWHFYRVLTMAYCIGNKLLYELCPQTCVKI
jgi:hypothetical protein